MTAETKRARLVFDAQSREVLRIRLSALALLVTMLVIPGAPQTASVPAAITSDPPTDASYPPYMDQLTVPSHGGFMNGRIYGAGGPGNHPTAVLLHGFPGYEPNLDLAQSMRRAGWSVVLVHYRGSWGSGGRFSFSNAIEDTHSVVQFLRKPGITARHRLDLTRVVLVGHSMGGFMAAWTAAQDVDIAGAILLSPWNIGRDAAVWSKSKKDHEVGLNLMKDAIGPLRSGGPDALEAEVERHAAEWDLTRLAANFHARPVLVLAGSREDDLDIEYYPLISALRAADAKLQTGLVPTDHSYSDQRIRVQIEVLNWLDRLVGKRE
jgi:acetyl esterase/lipase